jgi:hypothetical protein
MNHVCTPAGDHPKLPAVGDSLLFVAKCYGPPTLVTVVAVHMGDMEDLNVWRWRTDPATGQPTLVLDQDGLPVLVDWPNPNIELVDTTGVAHVTRQIRHRGSPGWTWPLHLAREE